MLGIASGRAESRGHRGSCRLAPKPVDPVLWPSGMPGSKDTLSDEIWSIVVYLRHLPPVLVNRRCIATSCLCQ